jgi:hypothetical protein
MLLLYRDQVRSHLRIYSDRSLLKIRIKLNNIKLSDTLNSGDVTSLQSAKMHLTEATKNIKMDNSQAALMQINMTRQAITLAGLKLNAVMCNNIRNEDYCVSPNFNFWNAICKV